MRVAGATRKAIALIVLAVLAGLAWSTIEPGRILWVALIVLGAFAVRVVLTSSDSRDDSSRDSQDDVSR